MASDLGYVIPSNIKRLVSALRPDGQQGSWCLGTAEQPLSGKQSYIFVLAFPDTTKWAIRVPVHGNHLSPDVLTSMVDTEVNIVKTLQDAGFTWSPNLITADSEFNNILHFPYIILSWIPGKPLQWSDTVPAQRKHRNKIISQVMDMIVSLANATTYGKALLATIY
jgi:hypothetical protein